MNYSYSWHEYINQLHQHIKKQDQRVKMLEDRLIQLENKNNASNQTTIEKLEYHFDQLKIERLDGTLHIGLTPEDLSKVEDLSLSQQQTPSSMNQNLQRSPLKQRLVNDLDKYITGEGPTMVHQLANDYNFPLDSNFETQILNDVRRQLPERITFYEEQARSNNSYSDENQLGKQIYEQVQKEITSSLQKFFQNERQKEIDNHET